MQKKTLLLDAMCENHNQSRLNHNIFGHMSIVTAQHEYRLFSCPKKN